MILPFSPVVHWVGGILCLVEVPVHEGWIVSRRAERRGEPEDDEEECLELHLGEWDVFVECEFYGMGMIPEILSCRVNQNGNYPQPVYPPLD